MTEISRPLIVCGRLSVAALLMGLLSCDALGDMNRTGGDSRRGYFTISPDADLALGSSLDFAVADYESLSAAKGGIGLSKPKSENKAIATVRSSNTEGTVNLGGVKAGSTSISFTATADEESIEDSFEVHVTKVTDLSFQPCANNAAYVRGTKVRLPYRFNESASRDVLGRGLYPLTISPTSSVSLDKTNSDERAFSFSVSTNAASLVTIRSSLSGDDTKDSWNIIDESEIDDTSYGPPSSTDAGRVVTLDLRPLANGRVVCSDVRRILRNLNPYACTIEGEVEGQLVTTKSSANLSLDAVGACLLELEYPGSSRTFALDPIIVTEPSKS